MSIRSTQPVSFALVTALCVALLSGCATPANRALAPWPRYVLNAAQSWQLNLPDGQRFDASGLFLALNGDLLTVNDRGPLVYRVQFSPGSSAADLVKLPDCFTPAQLAALAGEKPDRFDIEGIAGDVRGRLYLCEESNRWILRFDPRSHAVERLKIDWTPVQKYFSATDRNASFEGVAIGDDKLYVANERERGRIIVVDLATLKVAEDFEVRSSVASFWGPQYSDLCWFGGELYVLMREDHVVLRVHPRSHQVLAEYDFSAMESAPENKYRKLYWFAGVMEGLAVDEKDLWLVTDNNGLGRAADPNDRRPTLFRCPRPDRGLPGSHKIR
jgi:hypothetical protein